MHEIPFRLLKNKNRMEKETIGCMKDASQSRHLSPYLISNFGATKGVFKFNGFLFPADGVTRFPAFLKQK